MINFKKAVCLLIALCLFSGLILTGCKSNSDQADTPKDGENSSTTGKDNINDVIEPRPVTEFPDAFPLAPSAVDPNVYKYDDLSKKYSFEIMLSGAIFQSIDDDPIKKYMDEKFNTDVTFTSLKPEDLRNTVAVRYSSGDAPDVVKMPFKEVAITLFDQGNLVEGSVVLPYMPQLAQYVTKSYRDYATVDGKMIGIPRYPTFADNWGLFIRKDWLEAFGMDKPATEDQLFEYATACVQKDPNRNGEADTWFMGGAGSGNGFSMLNELRTMYGHTGIHVVDNKINHPILNGSTRDFLKFLNKLYSNNLLTPDWYTIDWERFKSYSMNGQVGMLRYPGWNLIDETYNAHNKDAESIQVWEPMDPLVSNDGRGGKLQPGSAPDGIYIFKKELEDDMGKLKRIAHFLDTCMYPNENYWTVSQGGGPEIYQDGSKVTFNSDGTNVFYIEKDVHPAYTEQKNNCLWDWQFIGYSLIWQVYDDEPVGVLGSKHNMYVIGLPRYTNYGMLINPDPVIETKLREFNLTNEIAFVLGKRSFDEWDQYVKEWKDAGGQEYLENAAEQLGVSMP